MTQNAMRSLERWAGKPLCAVLTGVRRIREAVKKPAAPQSAPPRKILLLKLIEQGASVLAASAIDEAIRRVGAENVYFWVFEENQDIVKLLERIPEPNILVLRHRSLFAFLSSLASNLRTVWRERVDAVIDMEFFSRASAALAYLSGASIRVGLHRFTSEAPYRGDLFTHRVAYNPFLHTAKAYLHLVLVAFEKPTVPAGKMDVSTLSVRAPRFKARPGEIEAVTRKVSEELGSAVPPGSSVLLLNPNASDLLPLRKWPTENFIELARRLLQDPACFVLLTGAPNEAQETAAIAGRIDHPRCASMAGKTSLRELFCLYDLSDVLVTNDSGPGHFASMSTIDSVVLFGPETPELFGPIGRSSHVLWNPLACSPCVNAFNHRLSPCSQPVCMEGISVDRVFNKVRACLQKRALKPAHSLEEISSHQLASPSMPTAH